MRATEKYAIEAMTYLAARPGKAVSVKALVRRCGDISYAAAYTVNRALIAFGWVDMKKSDDGTVRLYANERTEEGIVKMSS